MPWIVVQVGTGNELQAVDKIELSLALAGRKVSEIFTPVQGVATPDKKDVYIDNKVPGYVLVKCDYLDNELWQIISYAKSIYDNSHYKYRILDGFFTDDEVTSIKDSCIDMIENPCPEEELSILRTIQIKLKELVIRKRKKRNVFQLPRIGFDHYMHKMQVLINQLIALPKNIKERLYIAHSSLAL